MDLQPTILSVENHTDPLADLFQRIAKWNLETRYSHKCIDIMIYAHTFVASQTFGTTSYRDGAYYTVYVEKCTKCGKEKIANAIRHINVDRLDRLSLSNYIKPLADESSFFYTTPDKA